MRHLLGLLTLALALPTAAADVVKPITTAVLPALTGLQQPLALPALPALPAASLPSLAAPAIPSIPVLASPLAQAPAGVPLPAGARAQAQPAAQADGAKAASAFEASRRVADAAAPQAAPGAVESVSASVFDGLRRPSAPVAAAAPAARAPARASDETAGLSGRALLEKLHDISGRGYRAHEYDEAHKFLFKTADQATVGGKAGVVDAYSGVFEPGTSDNGADYGEHGDQNHDGRVDDKGMNVEHVWPQSFFAKKLPMRSDLHHLMATFIYPNGVRGNLPFGEVRGAGDYSNDAGAKRGQGVFEPPDSAKGRVARALLYFYTRYYDRNISNGAFGDAFWNDNLEMILRWNRRFPPTEWERSRNDAVQRFQGNRNPFVDDPALADRIGVDGLRRAPALQFHERARIIRRRLR